MPNGSDPSIKSFAIMLLSLVAVVAAMSLLGEAQPQNAQQNSRIATLQIRHAQQQTRQQERQKTRTSIEDITSPQEPALGVTDEVLAPEAADTPTPDNQSTLTVESSTTPREPAQTKSIDIPSEAEIPATPHYTSLPQSFDTVNSSAQSALVNILCASSSGSPVSGATGSGVIIDSRGVVLTNAHVAQYVLLQHHPKVNANCVLRTGAPAVPNYTIDTLAFPQTWVNKHGGDLLVDMPTGTGEDDWALLYVTGRTDGTSKPASFPAVPFDTRQAVTKTGDSVLLASYPAGFLGNIALLKDLWPVTTIVAIQKVYTFTDYLVDVLSLGGNIVAQSGSSGGPVLNSEGELVGIISVSSLGATTSDRDLRAITLSHINQSIQKNTGTDLMSFLQSGNFADRVQTFQENAVPNLLSAFPI